ncbi:dermonecrotic toxin domain-containing protein [Pseudomonas sp. LB3P31]
MTDKLDFDFELAPTSFIPSSSPLPPLRNTSLYLSALARWHECRQGWLELLAASPGVRDTIDHLLKRELNLDGQTAGLLFGPTPGRQQRFVGFTDACAFVLQHPSLETTLDEQCQVSGLDSAHPLAQMTPVQMLGRLKSLDPVQAQSERWRSFWEGRATGTAMSRQAWTNKHYRNHFEAAAQLAYAEKKLTKEQLAPLLLIIDPPDGALTLNGIPIHTEQLALVLSNQARVKLTGAWVVTVGDPASVINLLYLPSRPVAIQPFNQRSDMEDWLTQQALVPIGLPTDNLSFEYSLQSDPITLGANDLLAARQQAQVSALRHGSRGKPGLAANGAQSLVQVEQVERQMRIASFIALPPKQIESPEEITVAQLPLFGSLYPDTLWEMRQAALANQREALEKLIEEVGDGSGLQPFKDQLEALVSAEKAADRAVSDLLHRSRTLDLVTFQRAFTDLHSAHKSGLRAEIALQAALKQLNSDEQALLLALLDSADDPVNEPVAASLTLTLASQDTDQSAAHSQTLRGVILVTSADALTEADSPHSVLLYWPGSGGGLQRFANRRELEQDVLRISRSSSGMTLALTQITGDALLYGLNQLTSEFEEQSAGIRQRHADPAQSVQRAEQLDALRKKTRALLQVPVHAARTLAFAHLQEQERSAILTANVPDWLSNLGEDQRRRFKSLISAYIQSMYRSHKLMTVALEPRDDFTRKHLHERLCKDFLVQGNFSVTLDLPDSVRLELQVVPAPVKPLPSPPPRIVVPVPSRTRSKMTLEDLAQHNIDNTPSMSQDPLVLRVGFMQVEVQAKDESVRRTLKNGITRDYVKRLLPELDLPLRYETLIRAAFHGGAGESDFVVEHRRESLIEPWRLMLQLQGETALLQKHINADDLQVLKIAIDANTLEAWRTEGKRVVLLPACLIPGGKDTPQEGPVTLSGVSFIEEQVRGATLLYAPDSPDGQFLRRYDSLDEARKALFNLCLHDKWANYLAGRAILGEVDSHKSRITQSLIKNFDGLIGVGTRWPATTSLAAHLLNAHMGRLIEAHRGTSRSNDALYFERYALQGPRAFNYIRMALGVVPFVGTAISLYDAWTDANKAAAAFLRGEVAEGLTELESTLMSLIDASMDLLPGEASASVLSRTARGLTRVRQLKRLARNTGAFQAISLRHAEHVVKRFSGYEYEKPISLASLQPATHGIYRNIYRHSDGDFIVRQGLVFKVERSADSRNWRLSGNTQKTYKQPIALDEAGQWDTYYGVYGVTFEGGGLGGGQVFGHLAEAFDPLWPRVIRERLPRWWVDQAYRRQGQLQDTADALAHRFNTQCAQTEEVLRRYSTGKPEELAELGQAADAACINDIELGTRRYEALAGVRALSSGNKKASAIHMQSDCSWLVADRTKIRVHLASGRTAALVSQAEALMIRLDEVPQGRLDEYLGVLEELRNVRVQIVHEFDQLEELIGKMNQWFGEITPPKKNRNNPSRDELTFGELKAEIESVNQRFHPAKVLPIRIGHLLEMVKRVGTTSDMSWIDLQRQTMGLRERFERALLAQFGLAETNATRAQRTRILEDCLVVYTQFRRGMQAWTSGYPQHFHMEVVDPLLMNIEKLSERARKGIAKPASQRPAGHSNKKIFTTEDDQLLIGVEHWEPTTQKHQFTLTGQGGHVEIWEQGSDGKFRLLNPRSATSHSAPRELESLLTDARNRLQSQATYQTRVQSYADRDMLPVDLEHLMLSEAQELTRRAAAIEAISPRHELIQQLRDKATELTASGRTLRTRQALRSKKPTDGMLDDLVRNNAVEVRRINPIKYLGKRRDGRNDHMQEYEIRDLSQTPPTVLWYAHFHYTRAAPAFAEFEKAHLKLPEHRYLTHADDAELPYSDIGKRSTALVHFENL